MKHQIDYERPIPNGRRMDAVDVVLWVVGIIGVGAILLLAGVALLGRFLSD